LLIDHQIPAAQRVIQNTLVTQCATGAQIDADEADVLIFRCFTGASPNNSATNPILFVIDFVAMTKRIRVSFMSSAPY